MQSISFGSCYIYSPRGDGLMCGLSRMLCERLKSADPEWLPKYAREVHEQSVRYGRYAQLFGRETVLVPIPGSGVSRCAFWAAERLAFALKEMGLARTVWPCLHRKLAVRKSASALTGERPTVAQHYDSFAVEPAAHSPQTIVLIDDVITKGRTLLAAAARVREAFPNAHVRAFALIRTMGFLPAVAHLLEPCEGFVYWARGDARRDP
jgi:hypothetical protein